MREIKFRVWNKMRDMFIIGGMTPKEIQDDATQSMQLPMMTNEDCVWQQFTGLYDVDGIEVYEGDIIKYSYQAYEGRRSVTEIIEFEAQDAADDMDNNSYGYHINPNWEGKYVVMGHVNDPKAMLAKITIDCRLSDMTYEELQTVTEEDRKYIPYDEMIELWRKIQSQS